MKLYRGLSPHKSKKKFCPHKILVNFQIKFPHYNEGAGGGGLEETETMEGHPKKPKQGDHWEKYSVSAA